MKPRITRGTATTPDGTQLELIEHDGDFVLNAGGLALMSTRLHHSEEELARLACVGLPDGAEVLVGGLGMGYTLRAALDLVPKDARVIQSELMPEIVEWNRTHLGKFAGHPLDDPRVELSLGDVADDIRAARGRFAAILLDVDNGPSTIVEEKNAWLYTRPGLRALRTALAPGGRLAFWFVDDDPRFLKKLEANGFTAARHRVRARKGAGGAPHVIFVGRRR